MMKSHSRASLFGLTALALCLSPMAACASDICGRVFRGGAANPGFDAMERQRFVYSMTTVNEGGEQWATILVSAYPDTDPQVAAQVAGFYLRALTTTTNNTNPVDGRAGEWGFASQPSVTAYYDATDNFSLQIDGAAAADRDQYLNVEYLNVRYTGLDRDIPAIRVKFRYRGTLGGFRFTYYGYSENCGTGAARIDNYQVNFNNGTGASDYPVLSLDGSRSAEINAASPVITLESGSLAASPATPLAANAVDESLSLTGDCGSLVAATAFSPATAGAALLAAGDEVWYDKTGTAAMTVHYPRGAQGSFLSGDAGRYAIVSDPKTLDGSLESRSDGVNRLVFRLPSYSDDEADSLVTFRVSGLENGTTVTFMMDWEYVSPDCWRCECSSCDPKVTENSSLRGYSSFGDKNIDNFNRGERKGTVTVTGTVAGGSFFYTPSAKQTKSCDVIAFSNVRVFGCPDRYIARSIETATGCEGTEVTLTACGLGTDASGYTWYESVNGGEYSLMAGQTARSVQVALDLNPHSYYAEKDGERTRVAELQGVVCCDNAGSDYKTLWSEDFGTVTPGTVQDFPASAGGASLAKVVNHTFAPAGTCCLDGYYRVVSNSRDAAFQNPASDAWGCTAWNTALTGDHTGNANGGYLVINTGSTSGSGTLSDQMLQIDVAGPFCANTWYNFSLWATQMTKRTELPCTIVLRIYEVSGLGGTDGALLGSVRTGALPVFEMERWLNYSLSVQTSATVPALRVKVINEGEVGNGNDLALDDLRFTTCSPIVRLSATGGLEEATAECGDNVTLTLSYNGKENTYFPSGAWYLWQESSDNGATWSALREPSQGSAVKMIAATNPSGLSYRVIVAGSSAAVLAVQAGTPEDCGMYAISNAVSVACTWGSGCVTPDAPEVTGAGYCAGGDPVALTASATLSGARRIDWYNAASGGDRVATGERYTPPAAGTWYVQVTDTLGGCASGRVAVNLTENPLPVLSEVDVRPACEGKSMTFSVLASGAVVNAYEWTGDLAGTIGAKASVTAGDSTRYKGGVTAVSVNGCVSDTVRYDAVSYATPRMTGLSSNAASVCDGKRIIFTATAEHAGDFVWSGDAGGSSTSDTLSAVARAGAEYSVSAYTVSPDGCVSDTLSYSVTVSGKPVLGAVVSEGACAGGDITFTATPVDGGVYTWTGAAAGLSTGHEATVRGVEAGRSYSGTVSVTVGGCPSDPVVYTQRAYTSPDLVKVTSAPACEGGVITFTASASDADHYRWSGDVDNASAQTSRAASVSDVASGTTYSGYVTAVSANGCLSDSLPYSQTSYVTPDTPALTANQGCNSPVRFEITNYDPSCSYTWTVNGAEMAISGTYYTVSQVTDGESYTATARARRSGCLSAEGSASQTYMRVPAMPKILNNMGCDNAVRFTVENFDASLDYVWVLDGDTLTVTGDSYDLPAERSEDRRVYTMEVASSRYGQCYSNPSANQQTYMVSPRVRLEDPAATCFPTPVDLRSSVVESTADVVQFFLDERLEHSVGNNLVQQIGDNTYYAFGVNTTGCHSDTLSVRVSIFDLNVDFQRLFEVCNGDDLTMKFVGLGTQAKLYRYTVDDPDGKAVGGVNRDGTYTVSLTPQMSGSYHLEVTNGACELRDDVAIVVYERPVITAMQVAPETGAVVQVTLDNAPFSYYLDDSGLPLNDSVFEASPGRHLLTVYDARDCRNTVEFTIDGTTLRLEVPLFFTPNGDDINDTWIIGHLDAYPGAEVKVYNRFHKLVARYGADSNTAGWDGTHNGHPLPSGDYWYEITLPGIDRVELGHVTLYRGERR